MNWIRIGASRAVLSFALSICFCHSALAQEGDPQAEAASATETPEENAFSRELKKLEWVRGPVTVDTVGDSKLILPEGYVFLSQKETDKFLTLTENLSSGDEMLVAPESLSWVAYLSFADEGYVKDDEKIDADALLKSMQEATEAGNEERVRRGWSEMHVSKWAVPPAYNGSTKRLEWATVLNSGDSTSVNFFTKILGRHGHTTFILVTPPEQLAESQSALNGVLGGYKFNAGHTYAEYRPGDKVAEYGLAALVLGGAAAVATKKGFWGILAGFFAAAWKVIVPAFIALGAWLKRLFSRKPAEQ